MFDHWSFIFSGKTHNVESDIIFLKALIHFCSELLQELTALSDLLLLEVPCKFLSSCSQRSGADHSFKPGARDP